MYIDDHWCMLCRTDYIFFSRKNRCSDSTMRVGTLTSLIGQFAIRQQDYTTPDKVAQGMKEPSRVLR